MLKKIVLFLLIIFPIERAFCLDFVVIIPSYNNERWCEKNIQSVLDQEDVNYRVLYINDCSTDATSERVEQFLQKKKCDYSVIEFDPDCSNKIDELADIFSLLVNQEKHFFVLVNNLRRSKAMANFYCAICSCLDEEIVISLDGDDWLAHQGVLKDLHFVYSKEKVLLTHGNLIHYPKHKRDWCEPIPKKVIESNTFRKAKCPSHLRTFYSWLFKKINLKDLLFKGNFFEMTCDMAMMFPMIEMAGNRHAFIKKHNYVYNQSNPIGDNKVDVKLQKDLDHYIRKMTPYKRLPDQEVDSFLAQVNF